MWALRLLQWQAEPALVEVAEPTPGPGEVVVRVAASGACHSDLHLMHDVPPGYLPWHPPFTLGHENAGWVHEVGSGVSDVAPGDAVAVYGAWGCGRCRQCLATSENYCERQQDAPVISGGAGLGLDGGMAELLLVPSSRHLVPLPEGLAPVDAAPLVDAALTPYHAVRRSLGKLAPGTTAAVIGVGGLGHVAVQILKSITAAQVVAVDVRPEALELAAAAGADAIFDARDDAAAALTALTGGRGAEVVLDFVGSDETMRLAVRITRTLGDLTVVGLAGGSLPFAVAALPYEVSVQSTYWGSRVELAEVLHLAAAGKVRPHTVTYPLADAVRAYDDLRHGRVTGRAVVVPG